ncbi:MAG: hypothetical protein ACC652_14965, partial [Acidimicrobiales bacterium]
WQRLGSPGTWWTGVERVALAQVARNALDGQDTAHPGLTAAAARAAAMVAADPTGLSAGLIDELVAEGLSLEAYTEIVGVVARLVAVDTAMRGLGHLPEPLPVPLPGAPSEQIPLGAKKRSAWIPMVGGANPATALSGVTAESAAQRDLHGVLYLSYEEMGDLWIEKGLTRAQIELVAARTSLVNECVF